MNTQTLRRHGTLTGLFGFLAGWGLAVSLPATAQDTGPERHKKAEAKKEEPPGRALDSNLYVQTAAEYRACCYQAYNLALERLRQHCGCLTPGCKPPAVVMDLDETVLDNAAFQATLVRRGIAFDKDLWAAWEKEYADRVGLVPGARDFIRGAERLGVAVFYVSNRSDDEANRRGAEKALERLGIPARTPDRLLLQKGDDSDKTARRDQVRATHTIVLLVGDNLRDFENRFVLDVKDGDATITDPKELAERIARRNELADQARQMFGDRWIILPNPAYGEWTKALGQGKKDAELLAPGMKKWQGDKVTR
jgi:acid phosphatase